MGAERNSGWEKMSPVRIWAEWGERTAELEISPRPGTACCAPTKEWNGTTESGIKAEAGKKLFEMEELLSRLSAACCAPTEAREVARSGIWGLWELPTTQETPGRAASSSGARWA